MYVWGFIMIFSVVRYTQNIIRRRKNFLTISDEDKIYGRYTFVKYKCFIYFADNKHI